MREEILGFFRDIWPESYHIEDVPFILGYKGEEIQAYFSVLHELEEEGCIRIKALVLLYLRKVICQMYSFLMVVQAQPCMMMK